MANLTRGCFYADKLCVTPNYLATAIRQATGKRPDKLIDDYVMKEIRISLANFSNTISRISEDMGLPSPSFFGKYIKRMTGLSPRELRHQLY